MIVMMNAGVRRSLIALGLGLGALTGWMAVNGASAATPQELYSREDIKSIVVNEARRADVPPSLALAVARMESNFKADAISHKGAIGVMQIMPRTAWTIYRVRRSQLFNPHVNVRVGVDFLSRLHDRYGRWDLALSHYNGGSKVGTPPNAKVIPYTRDYVNGVLAQQRRYEAGTTVAQLDVGLARLAESRTAQREARAAYAMIEGPQIERNWRDYLQAAEYWLRSEEERQAIDRAAGLDGGPADEGPGDARREPALDAAYAGAAAPSWKLRRSIEALKERFRHSLWTGGRRWQPVLGDEDVYWDDVVR